MMNGFFLKLCDSCESRLFAALKIFQVRAPSLALVFKAVFRHKTYLFLIGHNEEYEAKRKQPLLITLSSMVEYLCFPL
ncbi:hypothetical protein V6N13_041676 [Hibiscus sabdariffa]|uniref:Uncharacterized protein n=1 Tax=Hibiscus sabdariffa TaxID=183260 RepID=A0ABR2RCB6_9ROSI